MLICELFKEREDGIKLYKTYSDKGVYIKKVNTEELYSEAIDIDGVNFIYEETDIEIEVYDEDNADAYL